MKKFNFDPMSESQAIALNKGDVIYSTSAFNCDGSPLELKVTSRPKVWKTRPGCVRVRLRILRISSGNLGYLCHGSIPPKGSSGFVIMLHEVSLVKNHKDVFMGGDFTPGRVLVDCTRNDADRLFILNTYLNKHTTDINDALISISNTVCSDGEAAVFSDSGDIVIATICDYCGDWYVDSDDKCSCIKGERL